MFPWQRTVDNVPVTMTAMMRMMERHDSQDGAECRAKRCERLQCPHENPWWCGDVVVW